MNRREAAQRTRGRRPGQSVTRQAIVSAARASFAARGYKATTVRRVAATAGVDPGLIRHFFGSKEELFAASVHFSPEVAQRIVSAFAGPPDDIGRRLVREYLALWEDPELAPSLLAVFRSAVAADETASLVPEFLVALLRPTLSTALTVDHPELRALLAGTQLIGVAVARYVLKAEPLASLEGDQVVALVAPTIQGYLQGELPLV